MALEWVNPGFAAGGLACLVPVLVHLLTRHARRQVRFPSIRFIRAATASRSTLHRLRHWILFCLRTLALAALALAFMRPEWKRSEKGAAAPPAGPSTVVMVLDASASMGYRVAGGTVFDRGRLAALNVAAGLSSADSLNLILAGARPRRTFDKPSTGRVLIEKEIRNALLTAERADVEAALAEGVRQLGRAPRAELCVVSDFQRSNWAAVDWSVVPPSVRLTLIPVGEGRLVNAGIDDVRLQPPFPSVGEEVDVACRVLNRSEEDATIPVRLRLGEEELPVRELFVAAGMSQTAVFRVKAAVPGPLEGVLSIPDDRLEADNRHYFVLPVSGRLTVPVLSDESGREPQGASASLLRALDPFGGSADAVMLAKLATPAALGVLAPSRYPVAFACGLGPLEPAAADMLLDYMRAGGSLVVFLAGRSDAANLALLEARSKGELVLPFRLGEMRDGGRGTTLAQANFEHPVLRRFRDADDLSKIVFRRRFETERVEKAGQVLAKYADQSAALASQLLGAGTLLVCNFSPAPAHGDLARRTLFVPLVHELVRGLRPGREGPARSPAPGELCSAVAPGWKQDRPIRFTGPDGAAQSATFNMRAEEAAILFTETARPGFYRVWLDDKVAAAAAVNLDRREGDLARLDPAQLKELARAAKAEVLPAAGAGEEAALPERGGLPLWPALLAAFLVCLMLEQGLTLAWRDA